MFIAGLVTIWNTLHWPLAEEWTKKMCSEWNFTTNKKNGVSVFRKIEATGDNCIKQIKIVSENCKYVLSHLEFLDFIQPHKIHSIKAESKLCGEQRESMGRRGTKDDLREIWGRDKLNERHIHVQMLFKAIKMRFNIKFPFSHTEEVRRGSSENGGESPTSTFPIPLLPPCFITKPSLGKKLCKRVSS